MDTLFTTKDRQRLGTHLLIRGNIDVLQGGKIDFIPSIIFDENDVLKLNRVGLLGPDRLDTLELVDARRRNFLPLDLTCDKVTSFVNNTKKLWSIKN